MVVFTGDQLLTAEEGINYLALYFHQVGAKLS